MLFAYSYSSVSILSLISHYLLDRIVRSFFTFHSHLTSRSPLAEYCTCSPPIQSVASAAVIDINQYCGRLKHDCIACVTPVHRLAKR